MQLQLSLGHGLQVCFGEDLQMGPSDVLCIPDAISGGDTLGRAQDFGEARRTASLEVSGKPEAAIHNGHPSHSDVFGSVQIRLLKINS